MAIILETVKASITKRNGNPLPGDKTLELEPDILFYEIKDSDKTKEGEEA